MPGIDAGALARGVLPDDEAPILKLATRRTGHALNGAPKQGATRCLIKFERSQPQMLN
jgi:hypothetical protein